MNITYSKPPTKIKKDKYWTKPHANLLRNIESIMGISIDDEGFAEKFIEEQCVRVTETLLVHKDVYQEYLKVEEDNLPCGYIWFDITDIKEEVIGLKNGQASTGDVRKRVTDYVSRGTQIILDVLVDDVFKKKNYDQELNKKLQRDYYSLGIKVENSKTVRTRENVLIPRALLFDFPQLKRNTLSKELNKKLTKRNFHASVSHEECLKKLKNNSVSQYFLLDCVMRFGKSFIFFEYIKRNYVDLGINKIHAVFCHDTKTVDGWISKADIYYTDLFDCVILKEDKNFDFTKSVDKNTIVFISQQLLHSNKDLSNPDEVYTQPLKSIITLDLEVENTFVDEVHQYFSPKWKSYFESITSNKIILASGTAANVKLRYPDLFDEDNTHTDTLLDLKNRLFKEFGIEVITHIKQIELNKLGSEFINMSNLQSTDETGKLVQPSLGIKFLDKLFKGFRTSPMTQDQISESPKHCPIYVDTIEFARLIYQYLIDNSELGIIPIMVAGPTKERTVTTESELKQFIEERTIDGKSTVMITCGSMIQGVSVEEFKDMINLSVVATYEMFYQFFGRGWEIDTTKMKDKKVEITMWDYNPQRTLKVAAQFVESLALTNGMDIPKAFQYFFQIHNIWDYVPEGNSFREISTSKIETEIREYIDSQVLNRGCKARLVTNTRPEIMGDISDEFLEMLLNTDGTKNTKSKVKEIEEYKSELDKQKSNHSKKSHELDIPKIPVTVNDTWQSAIDGLSVYTERIPIVIEVMYSLGKLSSKNVYEFLNNSEDVTFTEGFGFPSKSISKQFANHILKYGDIIKINTKVDNTKVLIPKLNNILNNNKEEFFKVCGEFDEMYKYDGDKTQLSVKDSYDILEKEFKNIKLNKNQRFHVSHSKSGAINLALTYLLKEKSMKFFGEQLTNKEVIDMVSFDDDSTFFQSLNETMGFMKSNSDSKDFIIINPPYKRGLHISIFNKSFEELNHGGTIICLHPSIAFLNNKPTNDTETLKIRNTVNQYYTELKFINGNDIFDTADLMVPLSITKVTKVKDSRIFVTYSHFDSSVKIKNKYQTIDDVFLHGNDLVLSIKDKIEKKNIKNISNFLFRNGYKNNLYLKINRISGHSSKKEDITVNPDFYQLIYKKDEFDYNRLLTIKPKGKKGNGGALNELGFSNEKELKNGFEFLKTKFARFCLSLRKTGSDLNNIDLEFVPYMDFTQEWTDEKLFDEFGLSTEEREFVNEYIPNLYERDKDK